MLYGSPEYMDFVSTSKGRDRASIISSSSAPKGLKHAPGAVALLQDFVRENPSDPVDCSDWAPLINLRQPRGMIDSSENGDHPSAAAACVGQVGVHQFLQPRRSEPTRVQRASNIFASFPEHNKKSDGLSRLSSVRPVAAAPAPHRDLIPEHSASFVLPKATPFEPWGRSNKPRVKRFTLSPGPGAYSPEASKSSVAVKFGRATNHVLPFRASYCEGIFSSNRVVSAHGRSRCISFTRDCRVSQLTASASHQIPTATCSPLIGPGTYDFELGALSAGHLFPLGPRGADLRSFRKNRALKHTYLKNENDAIIGALHFFHSVTCLFPLPPYFYFAFQRFCSPKKTKHHSRYIYPPAPLISPFKTLMHGTITRSWILL